MVMIKTVNLSSINLKKISATIEKVNSKSNTAPYAINIFKNEDETELKCIESFFLQF
jgi:hypothetical protein